jgi:hypothetical protein
VDIKDITGNEKGEGREVLWVSQGQTCSCCSQQDAPLKVLLSYFPGRTPAIAVPKPRGKEGY